MKNINTITSVCFFASVVMLTAVAKAEIWYFSGNEAGNAASVDQNAFSTPSVWKNASGAANAFSADDTYVLTNKSPTETKFTEHSLILHGGKFANGARLEANANGTKAEERTAQKLYIAADSTVENPTVFEKGLLFGHNAHIVPMSQGSTNVIKGDISLINSDGGQNPRIVPDEKNISLVIDGKMTGGNNAMMVFTPADTKKRNFSLSFLGDVTWNGAVYMRTQGGGEIDAGCDYNIRIVLGNIEFRPYFRVDGNVTGSNFRLRNLMRFAVSDVDAVATLKNGLDYDNGKSSFPFHHDTYLEFPVDAVTGKAGRMVLETEFHGSTNKFIGVILTGNIFGGTAVNRFELMSVPVSRPLNAAAFRLLDEHGVDHGLTDEVVKFEVVNDETFSTLYAVVPPMVRYLCSDSTSQNANMKPSVEIASAWSDNAVPHAGKDYIVCPTNKEHRVMRTPDTDVSASWTFPGDSLTIASNASLRSYVSVLRIEDLRMLDGSAFYAPKCNNRSIDVKGSISVSGTVRFGTYENQAMYLTNSTIKGSGLIDFGGMWIAANASGMYFLSDENPDFRGKMIVRTAYQDSISVPGIDTDYASLNITSGRSLGADLPEPTPDALTLTDYAQLASMSSFVIEKRSNRGITVKGAGTVWASAGGCDITFETPITVDGAFYKRGASALTLAGEAVAVNGGGADKCIVEHGTLKVANSRALKGLTLELQGNVLFSVEINPDDEELTEKGVDLSDVLNPITLADSHAGKIPFAPVPLESRLVALFGVRDFGILTVKAECADSIEAMLPAAPPQYFTNAKLSWHRIPDETAGTVTFAVRCERTALRIIVR